MGPYKAHGYFTDKYQIRFEVTAHKFHDSYIKAFYSYRKN